MKVDFEQALALLERAVNERGEDYRYPSSEKRFFTTNPETAQCSYFTPEGEPSCIIGLALSYLGFTKADLDPYEGYPGIDVADKLGVRLDGEASILWNNAQGQQDAGHPWGECLYRAIEEVAW